MAKIKVQVLLFPNVIEKVRDIVYWTPGMTLTGFVNEALQSQIGEYERSRGSSYPDRKSHKVGKQ